MPRRLLKRRTPLPPVMAAIDTFKELEAMAEEQVEALELQIIKHPAFALGVSPRALTRPTARPPIQNATATAPASATATTSVQARPAPSQVAVASLLLLCIFVRCCCRRRTVPIVEVASECEPQFDDGYDDDEGYDEEFEEIEMEGRGRERAAKSQEKQTLHLGPSSTGEQRNGARRGGGRAPRC